MNCEEEWRVLSVTRQRWHPTPTGTSHQVGKARIQEPAPHISQSLPFHISIPLRAWKRAGQELLTMMHKGMVELREGSPSPAQGPTSTPHLLQL